MPSVNASDRRVARSRSTATRVLAAAREAFAEEGYAATTMEALARRAGVSARTVYVRFGTKRAILIALLDEMERDEGGDDLETSMPDPPDPPLELHQFVHFTTRLYERAAWLLRAVHEAAATEPDLRTVELEGQKRRRETAEFLTSRWASVSGLASNVDAPEASAVLYTLGSPWMHRMLIDECGWDLDRYQGWLIERLREAVLS